MVVRLSTCSAPEAYYLSGFNDISSVLKANPEPESPGKLIESGGYMYFVRNKPEDCFEYLSYQ